jgi:hypothetical protein
MNCLRVPQRHGCNYSERSVEMAKKILTFLTLNATSETGNPNKGIPGPTWNTIQRVEAEKVVIKESVFVSMPLSYVTPKGEGNSLYMFKYTPE